jgi:acetyl coenzyme A synthetase (ADP forming)-like protein
MNHTLDAIFRPKSVAVVGASTQRGTLGREIFDKLLNSEFNGPVYPIHPTAEYIHSVKAYPRISALPERVDLAVIVVRKDFVLEVVKECAQCGVKGLIVITAGFKETGPKGAELERELAAIVKANNMRMIGPNCMGAINTDPAVRLDATFAPVAPPPGNIGLVSQSGALGQTILEHAKKLNLGVSMFVSVGNKADVSGNDLLEYWRDDPSVEVILMYLESFGNPQKFIKLAKEVSRQKPIVIVKSGRTTSGARAATSHTGALAGMDRAFDALFKQSGVIRAATIDEMFDIAMGLANVPLPKGNRVAIITNAGGPGIMAADACESVGLTVVELQESTRAALKLKLAPDASVNNPVDLLAGAQPAEFQFALHEVLNDKNVDSAMVIFVAPIITDPLQVALKIAEVAEKFDKPVLGCFMGVQGVATGVEELHRRKLPAYPFPESAARALAAMRRYSAWLEKREGSVPEFAVDKKRAGEVIQRAKKENREFLTAAAVAEILRCYGIPFANMLHGKDLSEILAAAKKMRFPLALKVSAAEVIHKTEVGGVRLNLGSAEDLEAAYRGIMDSLKSRGVNVERIAFVVQEMVIGGKEVILGLHSAPSFGTLIMFGLGGAYVEVLQDVAFRITPVTDVDVEEMIAEIKGYALLRGVRGEPAIDLEFLKDMLLRLSQLAQDFPEILEMEINPMMVFSERSHCKGVDARMRIRLNDF